MLRRWKKFLALPNGERLLLCEALLALMAARLVLALVPFRKVAAWLGPLGMESASTVSDSDDLAAERVGWAVETMARHVPWDSRCLAQALAAWWMLGRRGIDGTVYFGVAKDPAKAFSAHAWLRCGTRYVTGGNGHAQFQVLACFARGGDCQAVSRRA